MGNRSLVSSRLISSLLFFVFTTLIPKLCHADFDSSLVGIQVKLTTFVLPTLSVIGMGIAAVSFFTGSPNAKQHMVYAILGCIFGFGAQAIVNLIGGTGPLNHTIGSWEKLSSQSFPFVNRMMEVLYAPQFIGPPRTGYQE